MKCNFEWLSAYLDGELPEPKRAELEKHLKACEVCIAKLDELTRLEAVAKKIPVPQLSEAYWENFANRVQNKIAIRDKQKAAPVWLENLKRFFQPSTGKLAIAGSLATILLVAIIAQDYWKKERFRPPVFEGQEIKNAIRLDDSLQKPVLSEGKTRQEEADKLTGSGRRDEPVLQKNVRENKQKELLAPPTSAVASKPSEEAVYRNAAKDERTNELDLDKGRIQNESAEENAPAAASFTANPPVETTSNVTKSRMSTTSKVAQELTKLRGALDAQYGNVATGQPIQDDTALVTAGEKTEIRKQVATSQVKVSAEELEKLPIRLAPPEILKLRLENMPPIDTANVIDKLRHIIAEQERELSSAILKSVSESLYIFLSNYYVDLYSFSLQPTDWKKADVRLKEFLRKDISDGARRQLLVIQARLKIIKK